MIISKEFLVGGNAFILLSFFIVLSGILILEYLKSKSKSKDGGLFLAILELYVVLLYILSTLDELNLIVYPLLPKTLFGIVGLVVLIFAGFSINAKFNKLYLWGAFLGGAGQLIIDVVQDKIGNDSFFVFEIFFFYMLLLYSILLSVEFIWRLRDEKNSSSKKKKNSKKFMKRITKYLVLGGLLICIFLISYVLIFSNNSNINESKELKILNWEDYFAPGVVENFEKEFDVKVTVDYYEYDEYEVFNMNISDYDLIVLSDNLVKELILNDKLLEINAKNMPNIQKIDSICRLSGNINDYSIPYLWGTTGIIVNTNYVKDYEESWSILWDKKYSNEIAFLDNPDEILAIGSKYLGTNILPKNIQGYEMITSFLESKNTETIGYFSEDETLEMLENETIWISQGYNSDISYFGLEGFEYFIPKEGGSKWIETFVIPKESKSVQLSEKFIDYIYRPEIGGEIANYQWSANCNLNSKDFMDEELLLDKTVYPTDSILNRLEFFSEIDVSNEVLEAKKNLVEDLRIKLK